MIAFLSLVINAPFSKRAEKANTPDGATGYVMARADYDGNFYWTHDSKKYEYALEDYGLSPENYEFGDEVKVYVNDAQDIIKVTAEEDSNIRNIEVGVGGIGAILVGCLIIATCIFGILILQGIIYHSRFLYPYNQVLSDSILLINRYCAVV